MQQNIHTQYNSFDDKNQNSHVPYKYASVHNNPKINPLTQNHGIFQRTTGFAL